MRDSTLKLVDICSRQVVWVKNDYSVLIDNFADPHSDLWPHEFWPRDNFDRRIEIGALGGHGSLRYRVTNYVKGKYVEFTFISPPGYRGYHSFSISELENGTVLIEHRTDVNLTLYHWIMWKFLIYHVHKALITDSFDKAEAFLIGTQYSKRKWPLRVYFIRNLLGVARIIKTYFEVRIFGKKQTNLN